MSKLTMQLDGYQVSGVCPLGQTLEQFFVANGLLTSPEVVQSETGALVATKYSLAILHHNSQLFSLASPAMAEVPALASEDLLVSSGCSLR